MAPSQSEVGADPLNTVIHTERATLRRYPGLEIGGRAAVDGGDTFNPPFQTESATFRRHPGVNTARHEALPPSYPSLAPTLPLPTAGRPILFSRQRWA
eukprot:3072795-Pyramimonas_sp.AAC.1